VNKNEMAVKKETFTITKKREDFYPTAKELSRLR
jgi:hypothetical protein